MPSSSNRSTSHEICLFYTYRFALARLQGYANTNYASFTKKCFAKVLDIAEPELQQVLQGSWPIWNKLLDENRSIKVSDQIFQAGNAFADAGHTLEKAGRVVEGEEFKGWASELWDLSLDRLELEEEAKKKSGALWN